MTKRIFIAIITVCAASLAACFIVVSGVLYGYFADIQRSRLAAETALIARGISESGAGYIDGLDTETRVTLVMPDGVVAADNRTDPAKLENHGLREEITEAFATGEGESERYSKTLAEKTLYRAVLLDDGSVVRVALTSVTALTLMLGMVTPMCTIALAVVALAALIAYRVSRRITDPVNKIDLEHPMKGEAYPELTPLLVRLNRQQSRIRAQEDDLARRKSEFGAVVNAMREGLLLVDSTGRIASINKAAANYFGLKNEAEGLDVEDAIPSQTALRVIGGALADGHAEADEDAGDGVYRLSATVGGGGVVLLIRDVTDSAASERLRREFTANVSHELKTPLQSVMGGAELLSSGMVSQSDIPALAGRIRAEAARLLALVDDVIGLSRLDEGESGPAVAVDLVKIAGEAAESVANAAEKRGITVNVSNISDGDIVIQTDRRLVYEIIRNLADNAVRYNKDGGRVDITVAGGAAPTVAVADTGVGIAPENIGRIFERFWRADRSRSKETGGTGLGLSIVKHAASAIHASVDVKSKLGEGSVFTVTFRR